MTRNKTNSLTILSLTASYKHFVFTVEQTEGGWKASTVEHRFDPQLSFEMANPERGRQALLDAVKAEADRVLAKKHQAAAQRRATAARHLEEQATVLAAGLVSFDTLCHGSARSRIEAWNAVLFVACHCKDEKQLNSWWRAVMSDARWTTAQELQEEAKAKAKDIADYRRWVLMNDINGTGHAFAAEASSCLTNGQDTATEEGHQVGSVAWETRAIHWANSTAQLEHKAFATYLDAATDILRDADDWRTNQQVAAGLLYSQEAEQRVNAMANS